MNDDEKAHYEEWKRKCAATRERKDRERVEAQKKLIQEKPGYRLVTRGPNKGQLKWMGYKQQRIDKSSIAWDNQRSEEEAHERVQSSPRPIPLLQKPEEQQKKVRAYSEIILAFIFIFSVSIISFLMAKLFAYFGIMSLAVLIDAVCYLVKTRRARRSRYLPFLWWFL